MATLLKRTGWQLAFLVLVTGCNKMDTNTVSASGVVTYAGSPVEGAEVVFIPKDPTSPDTKPARGTTDNGGQFTVKTYFTSDVDTRGVRPGDYIVTIQKLAAPEGMTMDEWQIANMEDPTSVPPLRSLVPEKYKNIQTSELTATIEKNGKNEFTFQLNDE